MYCGQCGTQNNEEAGHCETCGAPLLISAGARICSTCGASLGDHDRFCPTCGSSTEDAQVAKTYDASDDFGDLNIDDIDITELPDWLQEMSTAAEPQPEIQSPSQAPDQARDIELPDWLQGTDLSSDPGTSMSPQRPAATTSGVDHQPADQFSLVSDEDLPDWLKELGEEPSPAPEQPAAAAQQSGQQTSAVATLFDLPPVNRAWLPQGRRVDQSAVSSAQSEFAPLDTYSGRFAAESSSGSIWDSGSAAGGTSERDEKASESAEESEAGGGRRRMVRIVILVLLIVVMLMLAYFVIQGT